MPTTIVDPVDNDEEDQYDVPTDVPELEEEENEEITTNGGE